MVNRVSHDVGTVSFNDIVLDVDAENLSSHFPNGEVPEGFSAGNAPANASAINLGALGWTWTAQAGALPTL